SQLLVAGAALVLLTTVGLVSYSRHSASSLAKEGAVHSIAVLPLRNLSGDPGQDYFADGMTEALIGDLAQIASLRVISRTSTMTYRESKKTLPQIAKELNVETLFEGAVVKSGNQVRIHAQLVDGK